MSLEASDAAETGFSRRGVLTAGAAFQCSHGPPEQISSALKGAIALRLGA